MAASDARPVPRKNVAYRLYVTIRKSDGTLITSWTGADTELSLDGGSFSDATNELTEIGTSGVGYLELTAGEMNYDAVVIKSTVTNTGALPLVITLFPEEASDYRADVTHFGGSAGTFSGGRAEVNTSHWGGTAVASAVVSANAIQISGDSTAADNLELFFDGTGYSASASTVGTVTTLTNGVTVTTNNDKTGYSLTATTGLGNQTANITGNLSGSVGSVTGNVGGNVTGSVGSISGITFPTGFSTLTPSSIADQVWDEALSGHLTAGSTGEALNAAGSAGDPWTTTLPGSYTGSQAGKILADILVDTGTTLQGELDGIQADTEDIQSRLPAALVGGRMDSNVQAMANGVITSSVVATGAFDADSLAADAVTSIAQGVFNYDLSGSAIANTFGSYTKNIHTDTDTIIATIGSAGAGLTEAGGTGDHLTAIPWNASWDAEVQSEVQDAIEVNNLDHLLKVAAVAGDVVDSSVVARLTSKSATPAFTSFNNQTDSLEAIRDRGDAAWTTGGGGGGGTSPQLLQSTTIATLTSQTVFTLDAGSSDNDAYNGAIIIVTDQSTSEQKAFGIVSDYVGSTKTVTLDAALEFTIAVGDTVDILATDRTIEDVYSLIGTGTVTTNSPVDPTTNEVTIIRNATYDGIAKPKLAWTVSKNYTGWTGTMTIMHRTTGADLMTASVTVTSSTLLNVTLTLSETDFPLLVDDDEFGKHYYDLRLTNGTSADVIGPYIVHIVKDVTGV